MSTSSSGFLFLDFFFLLRKHGIPVSIREWMMWLTCLKGMVAADLNRFYSTGRAILVKHERYLDVYDQCFAHYFGNAPAPKELKKALNEWLSNPLPLPELDSTILNSLEHLDLDRLREMFEERLQEQNERHDGGSKWIGTGGTSPFGHNGRHPSGMRVGGQSRNRSAVQIAGERRFKAYRSDRILDTRQMSTALRKLRTLGKSERLEELDLDETISATARQGGDLEIVFKAPKENRLKLVLLMDVGGSMDVYAHWVERLFSAAHQAQHFKSFTPLYFHNCIYDEVYEDTHFRQAVSFEDLKRNHDRESRLLILGDACMSPYELLSPGGAIYYDYARSLQAGKETRFRTGLDSLEEIKLIFKNHAWINPMESVYWGHTTIQQIRDLFPMFELTLDGLESAVDVLRTGKSHLRR
jgi:hypothetical protein